MSARARARKLEAERMPTCRFCGRSGTGVQFAMFMPRFKPFGTACVDCEKTLPAGTPHPDEAQPKEAP